MQLLAVNFHYIRDVKPDRGIFPRSVEEFISQVEELGNYYEFISLHQLKELVREGGASSGKYCTLTFDDNLKEQLTVLDFLERGKIPAIFFSTTMPYIDQTVHDVHKMHHIYVQYSDDELAELLDKEYGFYDYEFTEEQLCNSYKYDNDLKKRIKLFLNFCLSSDERKDLVDDLFFESIESLSSFMRRFYFSKNDLRMLSDKDMLGTHTHSHLPLSTVGAATTRKEIQVSVSFLEELTDKKISAISYPYGRHGAVDEIVERVARECGLEIGFTMFRGINSRHDFDNPLMLKRVDTNDAPGGKLCLSEFYPQTK